MKNTNYANSRPRSVKPKKRTGFTMMEMMITLAIMAILFGLAVPAVAQIQKNLEIARLNSYAKDVYLAAQNRLMSLRATGELNRSSDLSSALAGTDCWYTLDVRDDDGDGTPDGLVARKPHDWDFENSDGTPNQNYVSLYGVMHNPKALADDVQNRVISEYLVPEVSVTSSTLDGYYYIEFNPLNGDVYAVFYTDAKTGFTAEDIHNLTTSTSDAEIADDDNGRKSSFRKKFPAANGEIMLGYYRGDPTDLLEENGPQDFTPICEIVNKEDLYIKVTCDLLNATNVALFQKGYGTAEVTLKNDQGSQVVIPLCLSLDKTPIQSRDERLGYKTNANNPFVWTAIGSAGSIEIVSSTQLTAYILLDSLDNAADIDTFMTAYNASADFAQQFKDGCVLEASANFEMKIGGDVYTTIQPEKVERQHSLFGAATLSGSTMTVDVSYVRHLQNLNAYGDICQASATTSKLIVRQKGVESVPRIGDDGEQEKDADGKPLYDEVPPDIHFTPYYVGPTKVEWYWEPDYLVGEPLKGNPMTGTPALQNPIDSIEPIELFTGTQTMSVEYNGNGYGLYDFNVDGTSASNTGLFGSLTKGLFSEVNLIDPIVTGDTGNVGGLVGYVDGVDFYNCAVRLTDIDPSTGSQYLDAPTHVANHAITAGRANNVGGLVGYAVKSTIESSYAAVRVIADDAAGNVGGLVGRLESKNVNQPNARNAYIRDCYTSELTSGGTSTGGVAGRLHNVEVKSTVNGSDVSSCYATGNVNGAGTVGGFVGTCAPYVSFYNEADASKYYAYGKVTGTGTNVGGFVGTWDGAASFNGADGPTCFYLRQTGYNAYDNDPLEGMYKSFDQLKETRTVAEENTCTSLSHPYTIAEPMFPFPMARTFVADDGSYTRIEHYGDWPVAATIQTCLVYYEKYDDGTYGFYGNTSLVGDNDTANTWNVNTLLAGDAECVEDGYAVLSSTAASSILDGATPAAVGTAATSGSVTFFSTVDGGLSRSESMYLYPLTSDYQGMSSAYASNKQDQGSGNYYEKLVLTIGTEKYTFFYCPVLAKSSINPTPDEVMNPASCPTAAQKAETVFGDTKKPDAGIVRSARQLNAIGRMPWFWNMNFSQECHVNFGTYGTMGMAYMTLDLSGNAQDASATYRNKSIGSYTATAKKPYTGNYNGNGFKVIDYCLNVVNGDSIDAGLFGLLYKGSVRNVVLYASDPKGNAGAGTAWIKSSLVQGYDALNMAPLVGRVEYDKTAFQNQGEGSGTSGSSFGRIENQSAATGTQLGGENQKTTLDNATGTLAVQSEQTFAGTVSGKWNTIRSALVPTTSEETTVIVLTGNFGTISNATIKSEETMQVNYVNTKCTLLNKAASDIEPGKVTFTLKATDFTMPESRENAFGNLSFILTGDCDAWTRDDTTISVTKYTTAPPSSGSGSGSTTGESADPHDYRSGIVNMSVVENCAVSGYVVKYEPDGTMSKPVQIGGLVGKNQGEIYNCSAANRSLSASGNGAARYIGGVAGVNKGGIIGNCYSGGLLNAVGPQSAYVGGLVGEQQWANSDKSSDEWNEHNTKLVSSYSYCEIEDNATATIFGVAGGSNDMIVHSHYYLNAIKDYGASGDAYNPVYDRLGDKTGGNYSYVKQVKNTAGTYTDVTVNVNFGLTYAEMKKLFKGNDYALSGGIGIANYDHSWPYNLYLVGNYPFPAVVMDDEGYFVHYGDWPDPNGTIFTNTAAFAGQFWQDFCVDAKFTTDYNYYWNDWLKELKSQSAIGELKAGDYIEVIIEPEFKYEVADCGTVFECALHSLQDEERTSQYIRDDGFAYQNQNGNYANGNVYQFLFDVEGSPILTDEDPQLWVTVDYNRDGDYDKSWKSGYDSGDRTTYPEEFDPFRINRLTVNIYRDSSTSSTSNQTTRESTMTTAGDATETPVDTHLETLKVWDFEAATASNILSTDKGSIVAGDISTTLFAGNAAAGHSNHIKLVDASSFRMDVGEAFKGQSALGENESYQVEVTFALGAGAEKDMSIRPYLVQPQIGSDGKPVKDANGNVVGDYYYASTYTLVQKEATSGINKGKTIWATALYTFGKEGQTIDQDAYIVWIPRESTFQDKLNGDLYVDNVSVKKVVPGAAQTTSSSQGDNPMDETGVCIARFETNNASGVEAPKYATDAASQYRYIKLGGACTDIETGISWSQFRDQPQFEELTDTQYLHVVLTYPGDDYTHAAMDNFTFTDTGYTIGALADNIVTEIDATAFDVNNHTVTFDVYGPLGRSAQTDMGLSINTFFTYRNASDLVNRTVLADNKDKFHILVEVYDRAPGATAMPTKATTKNLSGGTAGNTWTSLDGEVVIGDDWIKVDSKGITNNGDTITWAEFAAANPLTTEQYLQVTFTANNATNPLTCHLPTEATMNLKSYVNGNNVTYSAVKGESISGNSVIFHVNGALAPVANEGISFKNTVATNNNNGRAIDVIGTVVKVEVMNTNVSAILQGDSFDVLKDDVVNKTATITLNGDVFVNLKANDDVTTWFSGIGGRGLTAKVASVNGNVMTVNISGTVSETPASTVTVTAVVPSSKLQKGGTDVIATGSFDIRKKIPRAFLLDGEESTRSFYVNEAGQSTIIKIGVANTVFVEGLGSVQPTDWFTGDLPAGLEVSSVNRLNDTTVAITIAGKPTEEATAPLTFKVPSAAVNGSEDLAVDPVVTLKVIPRPQVATPFFGLAEGTYKGVRTVAITCETEDVTIEYSFDNGATWSPYTAAVPLPVGETTIQARATKDGYTPSGVATATYIIEPDNNLIVNGYFEDGLDGWTDAVNPDVWTVNANGQLVYQGNKDGKLVASFVQNANLQAGKTYKLSIGTLNPGTATTSKGVDLRVWYGVGNKENQDYAKLTSSGSEVTFTIEDLTKFEIYISIPKEQSFTVPPVFDDIVLTEVSGGDPVPHTITVTDGTASPTSAIAGATVTLTANAAPNGKVFDKWTVTEGGVTLADVNSATTTFVMGNANVKVAATYKDAGTTSESSASSTTSETSTPSGDRTKVAQWVTKTGISYGYFYDGKATADVYYNCAGNATVGTLSGEEMQWQAFIAHLKNNNLLTSDAYLEVTFQGDASTAFAGAQAANATLTNKVLGISGLKASYADDVKLVFRTAKGLTYNSAETDTTLGAQISGVTSNWASGTGTVKVELYTGSTGGGETSESDTSTSESSTPDSNTVTLTNSLTFNDGTNATNTIPATSTYEKGTTVYFKVSFGQITQAGTGANKKNSDLVAYVPIKANGADLYPMGYDPSDAANANPRSVGTLNGVTVGAAFNGNLYPVSYVYAITLNADTTLSGTIQAKDHGATVVELCSEPAATYTVTVTGGTADKSTASVGDLVTLTKPTTGIPEGQEFDKWEVISGGVTITNDTFTMPASNVEIKATYKYVEYAITVYNGNSYGKTTAHLGETVQVQANAAERGQKFTGWTAESPAGLSFANASANETSFTMPGEAVTVRANFAYNAYNIIIKTNNDAWGTAQVVGGATTGHYLEEISLSVSPASGYRFVDWYVKKDLVTITNNKFQMTDTEVEITANFEKIVVPTYDVTVNGGTVDGGATKFAADDTVYITANDPVTGYKFDKWTSSDVTITNASSADGAYFTMPAKAVTVTANFVKADYTVTCDTSVTGGTISVNKTTANYGDPITVTATPSAGYTLSGITMNGAAITGNTFTMPASNVTVSATFTKQSYNITVNNDTNKGTVSVPASAQYGDTVTLSVTPKTGWKFDSWTVNAGGVTVTNNQFVMPANAVEITANYTADTSVAIASWTTSAGASEVSYQNGTASVKVSFNNVGADGKSFSAFMNGLSDLGSNQYMKVTYTKSNGKFGNARRAATTLDMKALSGGTRKVAFADDTTIVAYVVGAASKTTDPSFITSWTNASAVPAAADVTVTVEVYNFTTSPIAGLDESDVTKAYTVTVVDGTASPASTTANNTVTVTAATKSGYKFTGWTVDGTDYLYVATVTPGKTTNPLTFTMPYNNVKLTANYEESTTSEPSDTPTNLIKNGDFSSGMSGDAVPDWTLKDGGMQWTITNGQLTFNKVASIHSVLAPDLLTPLKANTTYTIAGDITATAGNSKIYLQIAQPNGNILKDTSNVEMKWMEGSFKATFTTGGTPENYGISLYANKDGVSTLSFAIDNLWLVEGDGSNIPSGGGDTPTQATTQAPKYKVTLNSVTGGTITASKTTDVAEGETITLTATPATGYTFGGWNVTGATVGDASAVSTTFKMPKGDVTVSATFNADTPSGNKYSLSSTISLKNNTGCSLTDNLTTPKQYAAGTVATFTITLPDYYQGKSLAEATLLENVKFITANNVAITPVSVTTDDEYHGYQRSTVVYTYNVTMNENTVISGQIDATDCGAVTVEASGGTSGGGGSETSETTPAAGNLLDSYSWETVSGKMTTSGNEMSMISNGASSADFRIKNISLDAGTYTLTGSVVNGFGSALEFHIGSQTETVPAGATQNISITLNIAAATSVDLEMIAHSYPGGPATVTGLALTKS